MKSVTMGAFWAEEGKISSHPIHKLTIFVCSMGVQWYGAVLFYEF